jgi:hypothetical protein
MKPSALFVTALATGVVAAAISTAACSKSPQMPTAASAFGPSTSAQSAATPPAPAAAPAPTTVRQLCGAQTWPRPVPDVVGRVLGQVATEGALGCWDNIRGVAPDGHDPLSNPAKPAEKTYRITAVSPPPGTPIGRHDVVTVQLAEVDSTAPPAFWPCDWVTSSEAARILGGPVRAEPNGDGAGSVAIGCYYDKPGDMGAGVEFDLRVPGAFPVDAASQFELAATSDNTTTVDGIGVKAVCVFEPSTTPPSSTLVVLLNGDRLFRATEGYATCDTLKQFAQFAIRRIGA